MDYQFITPLLQNVQHVIIELLATDLLTNYNFYYVCTYCLV